MEMARGSGEKEIGRVFSVFSARWRKVVMVEEGEVDAVAGETKEGGGRWWRR